MSIQERNLLPQLMEEERVCKKHGLTRYVKYGTEKGFRCSKCKQDAVSKYRKKTKTDTISQRGNKCQLCGYDKCRWSLHFHHVNPDLKKFGIGSKGNTRSKKQVEEEIAKCILVCANCHYEIEHGMTVIPEELLVNIVR